MKLEDRKIEQVFDYDKELFDPNNTTGAIVVDENNINMLMKSFSEAQVAADTIIENKDSDLNKSAEACKSAIETLKSDKGFLS